MCSILYLSKSVVDLEEADLRDLVNRAQVVNKDKDIRGFLHYSRGYFIQYIEGQETELNELYQKIKKDSRHEVEVVLFTNQFEQSLFPNWRMRRLKDRFFIEIGLEDILQNQLIHGAANKELLNHMEGLIWNVVCQISNSVKNASIYLPD